MKNKFTPNSEPQAQQIDPRLRRRGFIKHALTKAERLALREAVTIWYLTPEPFREPATRRELAKELGVSAPYISQVIKKLPSTLDEWLNQTEQIALAHHKRIMQALAEKAARGDADAIKQYYQYCVEPRRAAQENAQRKAEREKIERALQMLPKPQTSTSSEDEAKQAQEGEQQNTSTSKQKL